MSQTSDSFTNETNGLSFNLSTDSILNSDNQTEDNITIDYITDDFESTLQSIAESSQGSTRNDFLSTTQEVVNSGQTILIIVLIVVVVIIIFLVIYMIIKLTVKKNSEINVKPLDKSQRDDKALAIKSAPKSEVPIKTPRSPIKETKSKTEESSESGATGDSQSEKPNALETFVKTAIGIESTEEEDSSSVKTNKSDESVDTITLIMNEINAKSNKSKT